MQFCSLTLAVVLSSEDCAETVLTYWARYTRAVQQRTPAEAAQLCVLVYLRV